jgi:hypothetical protein
MSDTDIVINDRAEGEELLLRCTSARISLQHHLKMLKQSVKTARVVLAQAVASWQRGIIPTADQLLQANAAEQHQRRITDPKFSAAAQYARRTMAVGNIKGSKYSGPVAGMTKTQLMTKQIRERGKALPFSWKATPDAPPGSAD